MAGSEVLRSAKFEQALEAFRAEITRNGFSAPEGLLALLKDFALKEGESEADGRCRLYKRLWALLFFGNGDGKSVPGGKPTYVYPATLKAVIREIIPGAIADAPDPSHIKVYRVNIADLASAKWPAKAATKKSRKR